MDDPVSEFDEPAAIFRPSSNQKPPIWDVLSCQQNQHIGEFTQTTTSNTTSRELPAKEARSLSNCLHKLLTEAVDARRRADASVTRLAISSKSTSFRAGTMISELELCLNGIDDAELAERAEVLASLVEEGFAFFAADEFGHTVLIANPVGSFPPLPCGEA